MYVDKKGYIRDKYGKLVHRQIAYHQIYLPNNKKYKLSFSSYDVHHKDENKTNNDPSNLEIITREEHEKLHERPSFFLAFWGRILIIVFATYIGYQIGTVVPSLLALSYMFWWGFIDTRKYR